MCRTENTFKINVRTQNFEILSCDLFNYYLFRNFSCNAFRGGKVQYKLDRYLEEATWAVNPLFSLEYNNNVNKKCGSEAVQKNGH